MTRVKNRNGETVVLLNPAEKGQLYARELKDNYAPKTADGLSRSQRAYRSGYLDARKDNAKAYKHNKKKRAQKRKKS